MIVLSFNDNFVFKINDLHAVYLEFVDRQIFTDSAPLSAF